MYTVKPFTIFVYFDASGNQRTFKTMKTGRKAYDAFLDYVYHKNHYLDRVYYPVGLSKVYDVITYDAPLIYSCTLDTFLKHYAKEV